jgi:hypothetical protein
LNDTWAATIMKLSDYGTPLAYDTAFWMAGVKDPTYPLGQLGDLTLEVSAKLRTLAIVALLVKADSDKFYHNLIRSGMARETYLLRCQAEGRLDDHQRASGRYEPLLDVIASGDLELARRIASLSPAEFRAGHEYEDDYCYAQILHRLVQLVPPEPEIVPLLDQFAAYLDGEDSARFDLCQALTNRDQGAFDKAFAALLDERDAQIEAEKERGQLEEPPVIAQRQVFVEGLALLRLAEGRGLATDADYRFCPSLGRIPMTNPFPGE